MASPARRGLNIQHNSGQRRYVYLSGLDTYMEPRMAKLTLSMPAKDIRAAHRIAKENKTSISAMMLRIVRVMNMGRTPTRPKKDELPPLTKKLSGIISNPKGKSDREMIEDALLDRHGLDRHRQHKNGSGKNGSGT